MEGCFTFQWGGGGVFFRWGAGDIFKWGVRTMGGIGFDGGFLKKS